jgi:hypothetical protein
MFKRLIPIAGALGLLTVLLASSASAGGGGGYGGPGSFTFTDWSANANFVDSSGNYYSSVYVDRGQQSFKLRHTPGAPVVEQYGTVLQVNEQTTNGSEFGCWIIPPTAFVVASGLSSASLNIHATADMQCKGYYVGGATGGKPGLQTSLGYGGGGPGPNVITDITINLAWTGTGAIWTNTGSNVSHCQTFTGTSQNSYDYEFAVAKGSVGDLTAANDPLAQVAHNQYRTTSNSVPSAACNPYGF